MTRYAIMYLIVFIAAGVSTIRADVEAKGSPSAERDARKAAEGFLAAVLHDRVRDAASLLASTTAVAKGSPMQEWVDRFHAAVYKTETQDLLTIESVVANEEAGTAYAITQPVKLRGIWHDTTCVVLDLTFEDDRQWRITDLKIWNWLTAAKNFQQFEERLEERGRANSTAKVMKKRVEKKNLITVGGVCRDRTGSPLEGVTINIIRETYQEDARRPRVETFGRTMAAPDGSFQVGDLPPVWEQQTDSQYVLYFTLPNRPTQSLIIDGDLPNLSNLSVCLPEESGRDVYVPPFHAALRVKHGVTVVEGRDGAAGLFKLVSDRAGQ